MIEAKILLDSVNVAGSRLTTFELSYPRFIHAEVLTHRVFSRNAASSRAIPVKKLLENLKAFPVDPVHWGKNCRGMSAKEELEELELVQAKTIWNAARGHAIESARAMIAAGVHKQVANRIIEPFVQMKVVLSATEFENFFYLRDSEHAQPEIQMLAQQMKKAMAASDPVERYHGDWHMPLVTNKDPNSHLYVPTDDIEKLKKISVARCARVSYLTHDGKRDYAKDIELHDRLAKDGHMSPFEHAASCRNNKASYGNYRGWVQYRKEIEE